MTGTVRVTMGGRTYTATESYLAESFSGHEGEFKDFIPGWAYEAFRRSSYTMADLEGGTAGVWVDGTLISFEVGKWPDSEVGSADQSGFGFGGLDAEIGYLNEGYVADRSFEVRKVGTTGHGSDEFRTEVDGRVVDPGSEMRPFRIQWESSQGAGSASGGLGGML